MKKLLIILASYCLLSIAYANDSAISFKSKITGIKGAELKNAQARLQANQTTPKDQLTEKDIRQYTEQAPKQIEEALKPYGYFKAKVYDKLKHNGNQWIASYRVEPGPRLLVTKLNLKITGPGAKDPKLEAQIAKLPLKQGEPFTTEHYTATRDGLNDAANNSGYLLAKQTKNTIIIDLAAYTCIINVSINTGPKFYFGTTNFSKTPLRDSFLNRYLNYEIGQVFKPATLQNLQQTLIESGYFAAVAITPEVEKANKEKQVPIDIKLTPNKKKYYRFGLGYGTGTGARVSAGINWRWVNSYGQKFQADMQTSQVNTNFTVRYIFPGHKPSLQQYSITANRFYIQPLHGNSIGDKFSVGYLTKLYSWNNNFQLSYLDESYRFESNTPYMSSHAFIPEATFQKIRTNNFLNPTRGSSLNFGIKGADREFSSSFTFTQVDSQYKWLRTFMRNNQIILDGELGYTWINKLDQLPMSQQFYAGGFRSVRGYGSMSIGPGKYLELGTIELRRRIAGNWWIGPFFDAGAADNKFFSNFYKSYGLNFIWQSPVGPIQLAIAKPLEIDGQPIRIDFSIGPDI